jgi:hypothetical protein
MTPEEKAHELYDKYYKLYLHPNCVAARKELSKQCAIIAVDEILELAKLLDVMDGKVMYLKGLTFYPPTANVTYWQQVKEAILKL